MLDQLVESRTDRRAGRGRRGFVVLTSGLAMVLCSGVFVWSIMAMDLSLAGSGELELSTLVAPVPVPASEPPKPEPARPQEQRQQQNAKVEMTVRKENIARTDEFKFVPDNVSTTPNSSKSRTNGPMVIGKMDSDATDVTIGPRNTEGNSKNNETSYVRPETKIIEDKEEKPPEMKVPEIKEVTMVHSSIINGKATNLPKPLYSAAAIAVNAAGDVNIQVVLDEAGNVISAKAVSGHAMLRSSALDAARKAKFSPTVLNGQAVKVTGVIVYKFSRN